MIKNSVGLDLFICASQFNSSFFINRLAEVFSARLEGEPVVRLQKREELFDQPAHAQWLPLLSLPEVLEGGHVS